jgi:hypothetical protein
MGAGIRLRAPGEHALLQNEATPSNLRFQAAKELAPYVHPKLACIEARSGGM